MFVREKIPVPGFRNIKTALAVCICLLLYYGMNRGGMLLAVIAAVICMQDSVEKSIQDGLNRIIGTFIGGIIGILFNYIGVADWNWMIQVAVVCTGVIGTIYFFNLIKKNDSIVIGLIVFLILVLDTSVNAPIQYSINRIIDTMIGIVIAVTINRFLFQPKNKKMVVYIEGGKHMDLKYKILKSTHHKVSAWSGGTTTELYIYPEDSLYAERKFKWRLSTATVEVDETLFTALPQYNRHLMLLDGALRLEHEGQHQITLERYAQDYFSGAWCTKSYGKCTDFNLMLAKDYRGQLGTIKNGEILEVGRDVEEKYDVFLAYARENDVNIETLIDGKSNETIVLQRNDLVLFRQLKTVYSKVQFRFSKDGVEKTDVVAVYAMISKL